MVVPDRVVVSHWLYTEWKSTIECRGCLGMPLHEDGTCGVHRGMRWGPYGGEQVCQVQGSDCLDAEDTIHGT